MVSSNHGCDLNFGDLYLKGATESKIAEEEELKREIKFLGLKIAQQQLKLQLKHHLFYTNQKIDLQ